ncbi:serine/threonine protein kinase [Mycobacterium ostraviense]|uniref:Serine/threonine protein kinase n=1 Tax=Mycobacterium ostraviense TaxID=2738409 RepID=A0A164DWK7_9MYCO|nr:serine/threonine protein kinase [Mycobacterium ostraviense]KZS66641.1 serine/threonine protein kinase [Mycobacterium ostraviense]UGT90950.1 serine/threonine protein kinase [Mycobacterium ostraviense]
MSHFITALRAAAAAALMGSLACLGTATANADPTGTASDVNTLAGSVSKGYGLNNCTAQTITSGELAALSCGQNPDAAGPALAKYILFATPDDMNGSFKASIKDETLTACGDSGQSPTTWRQGSAGATAGQVACGTYQGAAEIIWTTDAKNVLSYIRAGNSDVPALYQWWRTNG